MKFYRFVRKGVLDCTYIAKNIEEALRLLVSKNQIACHYVLISGDKGNYTCGFFQGHKQVFSVKIRTDPKEIFCREVYF